MPAITETTPGIFNWIDLLSPDVDASTTFYTTVFGWDAEDQLDDDGNRIYTMFSKDGRSVAGLGGQMPGMEGAPPVWNSYIATDDIDRTTALVADTEGSVMMPPMDVMDAGRMAVFQAPDGAVISAWQPGQHIGAEVANERHTWIWNELMTRDIEAAKPFYEHVFGWTYGQQDMGPAGTYHLATVAERQMGGLMEMPAEMPEQVPNHWAVYFHTDDLEKTLAAIEEAGGSVVAPIQDIPGTGRFASAHDPQHGSFALLETIQQA